MKTWKQILLYYHRCVPCKVSYQIVFVKFSLER